MKDRIYFSKDYQAFFMELAANNHKEWFDRNKPRFQSNVKAAFEELVNDLINVLKKPYNLGDLKAGDCIFRINKDVRFSKDKTPYKLQMSALITKGGRKNMQSPGLYIEIGPEFLNIYTGFYMPEKDQLFRLRTNIAAKPEAFRKIVTVKAFKSSFGEVKGERSKILPPEFKEIAKKEDLIYHKQFYLIHQADADMILKPGLVKYIRDHFKNANDFNAFLNA